MNNFNQILLEAIKLSLAGIIGGLIGARANDKLTRRREQDAGRDSRKLNFRAFLARWRSEINTPQHSNRAFEVDDGGIQTFQAGLHQFHAEQERVRDDYPDREKFAQLVGRISSLKVRGMEGQKKAREIIFEAMDALIDFIKA